MKPARRISGLWNWLPAFRAVAETPHLPTAAKRLFVTPPALSRTIRLLEGELGRDLFHRRGRRLELNDDGRRLLQVVRQSMRRIDDCLGQLDGEEVSGSLRVSSEGLMTYTWLVPGVVKLMQRYPGLRPEVVSVGGSRVGDALLQGELDVAFFSKVFVHDEIEVLRLGHTTSGVYCGPGHPLYDAEGPSIDDVVRHPFAAPPADENGASVEGWPHEWKRDIVFVADRMSIGQRACESGVLLVVLPDALARSSRVALRRLSAVPDIETPLLAAVREDSDTASAPMSMVEAVRDVMRAAGALLEEATPSDEATA